MNVINFKFFTAENFIKIHSFSDIKNSAVKFNEIIKKRYKNQLNKWRAIMTN